MRERHDDWSAIAYVTTPGSNQTVLIKDRRRSDIALWKLPGGKRESYEQDPKETVIRELKEETGLDSIGTRLLGIEDRGDHDMYLFHVVVASFEDLVPIGADGEETGLFPQEEVRNGMPDFFPSHMLLVQKTGILPQPAAGCL
mgnify:CR=1 FL=1